ncbi:hypothetical protein Lal_00024433 [Lupinus albus]|nr:hypothetical protein Lal_00024433 [Lupinus albus]
MLSSLTSLQVLTRKYIWGSLFNVTVSGSCSSEPILAQARILQPLSLQSATSLPSETTLTQKNQLTSYVNGKDISLDAKTFSSLCWNIPTQGSTTCFGLVSDWDNFDRKGFYYSLCRISKEEIEMRKKQGFGETVKNRDILSCGYLKLEDRLLHYFMIYVILPKFSNHSQISDIEPQLMYAMKYNIKINWAQMIMRQMWNVHSSQSPLPYAIFITKILKHFGVSTTGETKVTLNLRESEIDVEVVHKMGFSIDPHDRRTNRH